ncbi:MULTISPECIES: metal ABC transporter ATP-binding protein [unclassified Thermotoga]|jgi:zinc transport system ATP-binding protein|uniref:metal ABC transporter ATP-binding protein n=1 Tax=unclassified Thermotoga TaxID=2631113 RepID=UPI0005408D97|nr:MULTISPECIES: metal ABC transporter ATP-binding protein [unclassified Thermotoga]AIY88135.1 ABC transporter-like protein [Thermotoga sp. Cell2]KHC91211.1 ABC transporter-like protein [Thermotoga sp. TBGT1765]KHC92124.1 ABC transporter-like protein [Thermotoga sp. TBGT1766]KHC96581.1 ABC transporter-like protein [Thermotoga sp. Xyl54]
MKIVEVKNLTYRINDFEILKNVTFSVEEGEFVGIIGPNGAGKTTLVRILVGEIKNYEGKVEVRGKIGYLPQLHQVQREFPITVKEFAAMGMYGRYRKIDWEKVRSTLKDVGILHKENDPIKNLSGGEFQRLSLARALLSDPDILVLDEPEAGVDEMGKASFYELLNRLRKEKNITVIMVSHDIGMVFKECSTIMCLNRTLHCHGPTETINPEDLKRIFTDFDIWIRGTRHYEIYHGRERD